MTHVILRHVDLMLNATVGFVPVYLNTKVILTKGAGLNVSSIQIVQKHKLVLETNVLTHALVHVVKMRYVKLQITFQFADALRDDQETHLLFVSYFLVSLI